MSLNAKFNNKNILFFSVQTFGYEVEIKKRLEFYGAHVLYFDERPSNSHFIRGLIRIRKSLYQSRINKYYENILKDQDWSSLDYCFVLRGEVVPSFFIKKLKILAPNCKFIFYTWDSFSNHSHPVSTINLFDSVFTFDKLDAIKHEINHRPLFFLDDYYKLGVVNNDEDKQFDLLFIGTAHSDRYQLVEKIKSQLKTYNLNCFTYYFMHSKLVYFYNRLFNKDFNSAKLKDLKFVSLNKSDILNLYGDSKVILDIQHPNQTGLTMRTFEALGARRKVITTNAEIKGYDVFNENNILIIDRSNPVIPKRFFLSDFNDYSDRILNYYSLDGWLNTIFSQ